MNTPSRTKPYPKDDIYLVTGGSGFIGSHVAKRLHALGAYVRIADIVPASTSLQMDGCSQYLFGNLCDPAFCAIVMANVHTVIHLAANMGGMGAIHELNDFVIYRENHAMTVNVLEAAVKRGVRRFLYASSACVYPAHLQSNADGAFQLRELDIWADLPPSPQGLYGLEKLEGEVLLHQFLGRLDVKVARFHNVYGPGGTWYGGREKAPAAFSRKAIAISLDSVESPHFEIWGDGSQRRSFLFIEDAVEAVLRLLETDGSKTVNIGSDSDLTMNELACLALISAGVAPERVTFDYDLSKPIGVFSRNSNNDFVTKELRGWKPAVSLEEGIKQTTKWIETQIREQTRCFDVPRLANYFAGLRRSTILHLETNGIVIGILLPITSRGTDSPRDCVDNLQAFAHSLARTTWRDTHTLGGTQFRIKVYLAVDHDDEFLLEGEKTEYTLRNAGILDVHRIVCTYPKGHVCSLWRDCAKRAWQEGCQYMTLLGDDVELMDEGWLREVHHTFTNLADKNKGPLGLGCVALTDITFPGMPTFPVLHRTHMDIFGEVVPEHFINQDGDPYLFQLYRRFGTSRMIPSRIRNKIGGSATARYQKEHTANWTFDALDDATKAITDWLKAHDYQMDKKLTLDVVIPSYRVQMNFLEPILDLKATDSCSAMFIIIVDDPHSFITTELQQKYGNRVDVRIRVNSENIGASASRNRGMAESAGEWIHFLDDDVTPHPDLLIQAEAAIRAHPEAAGFVGTAQFPLADTVFKTAVHLAGVTYFWDIARKIQEDVPWGVTANLLIRRVSDGVYFDLRFPKTGGGEDIDLCIRKRDLFVAQGREGFRAAPNVIVTHPWWSNGSRTYRRFYMWGKGDGTLVSMYPQHCYLDLCPNSAELILYFSILGFIGMATTLWRMTMLGFIGILAIVLANIIPDLYCHFLGRENKDSRSTLSGIPWVLAIIEGSLIRITSEAGRLAGQLERGEFRYLRARRRFDWFVGRVGLGPIKHERMNSLQRLAIWGIIMMISWIWLSMY